MKRCPKCGVEVDNKYCPECGFDMSTVSELEVEGVLGVLDEEKVEEKGALVKDGGWDSIFEENSNHKTNEKGIKEKFFKKKWVKILTVIMVIGGIASCTPCNHEWSEATCTEPKVCTKCDEISGEPLGHEWTEATCTEAKTCSRCGNVEGEALGHDSEGLSCTKDGVCSRCGEVEVALGHDIEWGGCTEDGVCSRCSEKVSAKGHEWVAATCTQSKTCSVCGETSGEPIEHTVEDGVCTMCGEEVFEKIVKTGNGDSVIKDISLGDWIYVAHFKHSGSSNFAIHMYSTDGDKDLAVNEIGKYDGVVLLSSGIDKINVTADGKWSCEIDELSATDKDTFSGKGDFVTPVFTSSEDVWEFSHDGDSNFAVRLWTADGRDLLVNEIGNYSGTQVIDIPIDGVAFFEVTADGNWSIKPSV